MTLVQAALLVVACAGTAVVVTRNPVSQAIVLALHGLALGMLALVLQAPDVALALFAVGAAITPMLVLLAVAAGRSDARGQQR
jgi:energy-converting hydrogenase B subunit D